MDLHDNPAGRKSHPVGRLAIKHLLNHIYFYEMVTRAKGSDLVVSFNDEKFVFLFRDND